MIRIHPIPDPFLAGAHEICNTCSCYWRDEEPLPKDEWCSEPKPGIGCYCHVQDFWDAYHAEMDRVDIKREDVLAEIDPEAVA
jgi:hypothetical protein